MKNNRYIEFGKIFTSLLEERGNSVSQLELATMLGTSQPTISRIKKGVILPPKDVVKNIQTLWGVDISEAVEVARRGGKNFTKMERELLKESEVETRPRILNDACAGTLTEAIDEYSEQMPVMAQMPRYDFTIMVRGDSMEPEFRSGDEIACLKVNEKAFVQWGKPHVLFTSQGIVVKRLYEGENGFRCVSDNKQYPEFFVPGEDVYSVSLVVGVVRVF